MVGRATSEVALQRDNVGGAFTQRVFCKCQELRVDGFINPLSLQNTWRGVGGGGGTETGGEEPEVEEKGEKEEENISQRKES